MPDSTQPSLEHLVVRIGAIAGALAATAGFVYVVGGSVMWLRFWSAGLPADQALALVPRSDLLVVGMRVMILPALAFGLLILVLARRNNGAPGRLTLAALAVPGIVLVLVVPLSWGAYAWPIAAFALAAVWSKLHTTPGIGRDVALRAAVAAMVAAALVSIARQLDRPVKLPSATLTFAPAAEREPVTGVLVNAGTDAIVLGFPGKGELRSFPRDRVQVVDIGPALDRRSPPRSLLSRLMGGDAWAATPIELWCGGESYGWGRLGDMCRSQPVVDVGHAEFRDGAVRVRVDCPPHARSGCSGFFTLTTKDDFRVDDLSRAAPMRLGRTIFQVQRDSWVTVAVQIGDTELRCLRSRRGRYVELRALLSTDLAGEGHLNGEHGQHLEIAFADAARRSRPQCSREAPTRSDGTDDGTNGTDDPGETEDPDETDDETGDDTEGTDDPEEEATATPSPTPFATAEPAVPPDPDEDLDFTDSKAVAP
jgi:hypothetical protein